MFFDPIAVRLLVAVSQLQHQHEPHRVGTFTSNRFLGYAKPLGRLAQHHRLLLSTPSLFSIFLFLPPSRRHFPPPHRAYDAFFLCVCVFTLISFEQKTFSQPLPPSCRISRVRKTSVRPRQVDPGATPIVTPIRRQQPGRRRYLLASGPCPHLEPFPDLPPFEEPQISSGGSGAALHAALVGCGPRRRRWWSSPPTHVRVVLLLRRPPPSPLPVSAPLLILLSGPRHRVQLWPSQGAFAGAHLTGPWPQDDSQHQHVPYMRDKATQTPRAWADERRRGSHKRSASCGSTDQLKEIAKLRQQLQRSKRSSRHRRDKERKSPFNGSHALIQQSPMPKTILIPIPISKSSAPRFRNSVEGLNQEIERITIQDPPEKEEPIVPQDVPDGHRAPPPVPPRRSSSTRSIDTQTPSVGGGLSGNHSNCSSRPDSISPSYLTVLNDMSGGGSPYDDKELGPCSPLPKYAASPRPNNSYMFKREPPEGCEKVKAFEETMPKPLQAIPPFLCPDRNKVNFIPNSGSAFCLVSILKPLLPAPDLRVGLRSLSPSLVPLSTQPCLLEEPESF
ncbi:protein FAM117B [Antennarius striatus]|uniref:protein FAM117B n=1 Tax=Antennarius striatus TaxID=241820 RepID=UPI0035ADE872